MPPSIPTLREGIEQIITSSLADATLHVGYPARPGQTQGSVLPQARAMIALDGEQHVQISERQTLRNLVLRPGIRLFLQPDAWFSPDYTTNYRLFGMVFFPDRLRLLINDHDACIGYRPPRCWHHLPISPRGPIARTLDALRATTHGSPSQETTQCLFHALLLQARDALNRTDEHPISTRSAAHTYQTILDYLQANCQAPIDRNLVAQVFALHPAHLSRLFKQQGEAGFNQTLNRLRLERASVLLRQGTMPVADIAAACGYGSSVNFIRQFRRHYAMTPAAFRLNRS